MRRFVCRWKVAFLAGCAIAALVPAAALAARSQNSDSVLASAKAAVAQAMKPNGTYELPSTTPPNPAVKGKNVWVISCGLAAEACAHPAEEVQKAAKTLGWKVTVYDGKFSPAEYNTGIRQAIAAKADGIIVVAIDCSNATGALQAAKKAGIKIVGAYAYDCSDPLIKGPKVFDATINSNGDPAVWAQHNAQLRAQYAIAMTNAKAKVLSLDQPEFLVARWWTKAFQEELGKCTTCKLVAHVAYTGNDLTNAGRSSQKLSTALLQHPDVNVLFVTSDALGNALLPAIRTAKKRNPKLIVIGNEGFAATQQLIREGVVDVAVGIYVPWMGWSAADSLNRVFNGQTTIPNQGLGYHLITKANVPPAEKVWAPTLAYQAAFRKIWTTKG